MHAGLTFADTVAETFSALFSRPAHPVRVMPPVEVEDESPVIRVLRRAGKPLTNSQLAKAIGCNPGQATKLRRKVAHRIIEVRKGRYVFVTLAEFPELPMVSVRKLKGNGRKS